VKEGIPSRLRNTKCQASNPFDFAHSKPKQYPIQNPIQKSKVKNQNDKSKSKTEKRCSFPHIFAFCILILYLLLLCHFALLFLHFEGICLDFGN